MLAEKGILGHFGKERKQVGQRFQPWEFESHDFLVEMDKLEKPADYAINGLTHIVPAGTIVGEAHFTPLGYDYYSPEIRSIAVWYFYKGLSDFMQEVETTLPSSKNHPPTYLYGTTNPEMASLAQRFGLEIIDEPFDDFENAVSVVGHIDQVREKLHAISSAEVGGKKVTELLEQRAGKELVKFEDEWKKEANTGRIRNALISTAAAAFFFANSYHEHQIGDENQTILFGAVALLNIANIAVQLREIDIYRNNQKENIRQ